MEPLVPLQMAVGSLAIVFLLVAVVMFALWVWVSYWAYSDAAERGMDSPALWGVVTFVGGVFGLLVYVLVRDDPRTVA